jgi:N-acetylglucosamine kinase-like BadF-type ATPase
VIAAVLAVDGGNSKTDVALVASDGRLLAAVRGPTSSHQAVGIAAGMDRLVGLVERAAVAAGVDPVARPIASVGVFTVAGADFPSDVRVLSDALRGRSLAAENVIANDCLGALWAGASSGWGIALICGEGINGAAISPEGRPASFDGIGPISGDWGGGHAIGVAGLGAAVRAVDGRGPRTSLEQLVPAAFGMARPRAVVRAMYEGRLAERLTSSLSPVVFAAAMGGDAVARSIVDRLADELATMAIALARRTAMLRREVEVVLAGGVFRTTDAAFHARIESRVRERMPRARLVRLETPPVAGAALEGLQRLHPERSAAERSVVRERLADALRAWDARLVSPA